MSRKLPVIGVAGGIGAGKSTVANILAELGALVIDSDAVAHEELRAPEVIEAVRNLFGDQVLSPDGQVDRKALGTKVFHDAAALNRLEDLLYPRIHRRRQEVIEGNCGRPGVKAVVLDAPKLYEAGVDRECDAVVFVDAPEEERVRRVAKSRGWTREELTRREKMQIPLDKKKAMADYVVVNHHSDLASLTTQLKRILDQVVGSTPKTN